MASRALALVLAAALAGCVHSDQSPSLDAQLAQFLEWFPGSYDSLPQTLEQEAAALPQDEHNYRRHSIFTRTDLPEFGEITFYAEQRRWLDDPPPEGEVYRQRIYVITPVEERQALRLRVHVPKDQANLLGAWQDPSLLEGLTPDDTVVWPGCDLFWKWEGEHFIGRIDPGACTFESPAYGQTIQLEEYLLLAKDEMHFADRGLTLEGEYLFGMKGDVPTVAERVVIED